MSRIRDKTITIRVTDKEAECIKSRAVGAGCGLAQYIIKQSIEGKVYCVAGIPDVIRELRSIGKNINQIARNTNINSVVDVLELRQIQKELDRAWLLLRQLTQQEKD